MGGCGDRRRDGRSRGCPPGRTRQCVRFLRLLTKYLGLGGFKREVCSLATRKAPNQGVAGAAEGDPARAPPRPAPLPGPRSSPALKTAEAPVAPWLVAASLRPPPLASHDSPGPLIFSRGRGPLDLGHALGDSLTRCGFVLVTSVDVGWGRGTLCSPALGRRQSTKVRGWAAPGRWTATRPPARVGREEARDVTGALLTLASAG